MTVSADITRGINPFDWSDVNAYHAACALRPFIVPLSFLIFSTISRVPSSPPPHVSLVASFFLARHMACTVAVKTRRRVMDSEAAIPITKKRIIVRLSSVARDITAAFIATCLSFCHVLAIFSRRCLFESYTDLQVPPSPRTYLSEERESWSLIENRSIFTTWLQRAGATKLARPTRSRLLFRKEIRYQRLIRVSRESGDNAAPWKRFARVSGTRGKRIRDSALGGSSSHSNARLCSLLQDALKSRLVREVRDVRRNQPVWPA